MNFLPSFPPESFSTLTHLRLDRSFILTTTLPLPQLKVLCSHLPQAEILLCPLLELFTLAPPTHTIPLDMMTKAMQSFPTVKQLVLDDLYLANISSEDILESRDAFSKILHLAVGALIISREKMVDFLSCFSSVSTLTISNTTLISTFDSFNFGRNLKELILLEYPSWQRGPREDIRLPYTCRFFDCLPELRTFRIGREMHFEDIRFKFYWPHHRKRSEVQWLPSVLSAFLCALGSRKERDSTLLPFRCPKLEHIHLTCIHLDDTFIEHLMDCLRLRHEHKDTAIQKMSISITMCTSNIDLGAPFPDVSELSYPDFEEVFDKHDGGSTILGCLFDP
jgi:hypothetical protein